MAGSLASVPFDVCVRCGQADIPVPHMVEANCTQLPLRESGTRAIIVGFSPSLA